MNKQEITLQESLDKSLEGTSSTFSISDQIHCLPFREQHHRIIILDNLEKWHQERLQNSSNLQKQYAHIGFAGLFNLQAACAGRHDVVILADCNKNQILFWEDVIKLLKENSNGEDFLKKLNDKIESKKMDNGSFNSVYHTDSKTVEIKSIEPNKDKDLYKPYNENLCEWLKHNNIIEPENYKYLHNLAKNGKILTVELDIHDEKRMNIIKSWLDKKKIEARSIYASNILDLEKIIVPDACVPLAKKIDHDSDKISFSYVDRFTKTPLEDGHLFCNGLNADTARRYSGFYTRCNSGDGVGKIDILCNSEDSEVFRCSADPDYPLLTIKGKNAEQILFERKNVESLHRH